MHKEEKKEEKKDTIVDKRDSEDEFEDFVNLEEEVTQQKPPEEFWLAIDFGSTNSCSAVWSLKTNEITMVRDDTYSVQNTSIACLVSDKISEETKEPGYKSKTLKIGREAATYSDVPSMSIKDSFIGSFDDLKENLQNWKKKFNEEKKAEAFDFYEMPQKLGSSVKSSVWSLVSTGFNKQRDF